MSLALVAAIAVVAIPLAAAGYAQAPSRGQERHRQEHLRGRPADRQPARRRPPLHDPAPSASRRGPSGRLNTERIQSQMNFTQAMYGAGTQGMLPRRPARMLNAIPGERPARCR